MITRNPSCLALAALAVAGALCSVAPVSAQIAGGTSTVEVSVTTPLATGRGVKKTQPGKTIYNDAGQRVGEVGELIISPDANVS